MPERMVRVKQYTCGGCGYAWIPRRNYPPSVCPKCKREDWNVHVRKAPVRTPVVTEVDHG